MTEMKVCIQNFPVNLFASVMGMSGLAIAYERYAQVFSISEWIGYSVLGLASATFILLLTIYLLKFFQHRPEVMVEYNHPVRANFFPAISISLLLLSVAYLEINSTVSFYLWTFGSMIHLLFTLLIISRWITRNYEITHSNPAWFIPVVGNIIVPIAGVEFADREISWFFFSIGLFFWISLFTIVFYRIIFHHQLAQKFIPTLFILIAPPAVGFVSYIKLAGEFDNFARILLYVALFFTSLLLLMFRYYWRLNFFISWWAYTFPLCAVTIASILAFKLLHLTAFAWIATALLGFATFAVALVFIKTIRAFQQNMLCKPEE